MLKHFTLATIGLAALAGAATADSISPTIPWPVPGHSGITAYDSPAFERMVEMCDRFGVDCSAPGHDDPDPFDLSPEARADAEKRLEQYAEEWEELTEEREDEHRHELGGHPHPLFGFQDIPRAWPRPHVLPRPELELYQFGYRYPNVPRIRLPHGANLPRTHLPYGSLIPWPSL